MATTKGRLPPPVELELLDEELELLEELDEEDELLDELELDEEELELLEEALLELLDEPVLPGPPQAPAKRAAKMGALQRICKEETFII